ncbi:MAG: gamma-glutamyl-gamma-aminobutyrate hydrolase family protein [Candidatus Melainabacteria bacterium]|nr:gamma-glutamyl-gamma-aminobutyrate hydrolase family protein [Candidatus Melainabacteria bacterium]
MAHENGWKTALITLSALTLSLAPISTRADSGHSQKPIIGVNLDLEGLEHKEGTISVLYYEAIKKAGGIPLLIPPVSGADLQEILPKLDGIMMIGGADYPPSLYNKETEPKTSLMEKERSDFDVELTKAALATPDLPVLGICAGCQVLNIQPGGSLIQDIPTHQPASKIMHASHDGWKKGFNKHVVTFETDSKLGKIYKTPLAVPTAHHQCIDKVASGFRVVAKTADGLPEAIEKTGAAFVVGVQFHPERDYEANKALFAELIRVASERHQKREKLAQASDSTTNVSGGTR